MTQKDSYTVIVNAYFTEFKSKIRKVQLFGVVTLAIYLLLGFWFDFVWKESQIFVAYALIFVMLETRLRIDAYRIKKGWFGNNSTEARELVSFAHEKKIRRSK